MTFVMKQDKPLCPVNIGFLSAVGIMLQPNSIANLVKNFFRFWDCLIAQNVCSKKRDGVKYVEIGMQSLLKLIKCNISITYYYGLVIRYNCSVSSVRIINSWAVPCKAKI